MTVCIYRYIHITAVYYSNDNIVFMTVCIYRYIHITAVYYSNDTFCTDGFQKDSFFFSKKSVSKRTVFIYRNT